MLTTNCRAEGAYTAFVPVAATRTKTKRNVFPSLGFSMAYPYWIPEGPVDATCSRGLLNEGAVQLYTGVVNERYTVAG